ncbi:unnamed protein product, partial [Phaeothamnion confervicola]
EAGPAEAALRRLDAVTKRLKGPLSAVALAPLERERERHEVGRFLRGRLAAGEGGSLFLCGGTSAAKMRCLDQAAADVGIGSGTPPGRAVMESGCHVFGGGGGDSGGGNGTGARSGNGDGTASAVTLHRVDGACFATPAAFFTELCQLVIPADGRDNSPWESSEQSVEGARDRLDAFFHRRWGSGWSGDCSDGGGIIALALYSPESLLAENFDAFRQLLEWAHRGVYPATSRLVLFSVADDADFVARALTALERPTSHVGSGGGSGSVSSPGPSRWSRPVSRPETVVFSDADEEDHLMGILRARCSNVVGK